MLETTLKLAKDNEAFNRLLKALFLFEGQEAQFENEGVQIIEGYFHMWNNGEFYADHLPINSEEFLYLIRKEMAEDISQLAEDLMHNVVQNTNGAS
jgi:hypothetical protein